MTAVDPVLALRRANLSDALCIGVLGTQVFLETYATAGVRPSLAREVLAHFSTVAIAERMAQPSTAFIVAEAEGHLRGFAQVSWQSGHSLAGGRRPAQLDRLYVQARFSGIGLGKALLRRAEDCAAAESADVIWLTAWVENRRALAFYRQQGYQDVGATPYVFEDEQYENRVMRKLLSDQASVAPAAASSVPFTQSP
jgi:diamine N-acetyltransferase